jgi:xanthine dehydrogenase/oxidase
MPHTLPKAIKDRLADYSNELVFRLNGRQVRLRNPSPQTSVVNYLHDGGMTGTKVGCEQGGCGACTVMISKRTVSGADHRAVNACLRPLVALADTELTTVEGIGNLHDGLDPVQHRIAVYNGTQCGFCTPGFVMNMHSYLRNNEHPTQQEIEDIFGGNLCRCTGYRPILHGMRTFACDYDQVKDCTMPCSLDPFFEISVLDKPTKIYIDKLPAFETSEKLHFHDDELHWIRPDTLTEAIELKSIIAQHLGADQVRYVAGNTAAGIYPHERPSFLIDVTRIKELNELTKSDKGIYAGAGVSIQRLMDMATSMLAEHDKKSSGQNADSLSGLRMLVEHGKHIAGIQVRNAGSIAGNIFITKSHTKTGTPFPSDLFTVLASLGTAVTVSSKEYEGGEKAFALIEMPIAEDLPPDGLLKSFDIPLLRKNEYHHTYRIARRPQMAHAVVNAGFRCLLSDNRTVVEFHAVIGGLASCNVNMPRTEAWLTRRDWNESTLRGALEVLRDEIHEIIVPMEEEGFTETYRGQLAENFFYKFFLHVSHLIDPSSVGALNVSASEEPIRALSSGMQSFDIDDSMLPLNSPIARRTAISQATGEVKYSHDLPLPPGGCYAEVVLSTRAHARFKFTPELHSIEERLTKEFPGFISIVTIADIPKNGRNLIGLGGDDPVFADREVINIGQPVCLALAENKVAAKKAAEYITSACISYEDLPAIISFDEAIEKKNVMPHFYGDNPDPDVPVIEVTRYGSDINWLDHTDEPMQGETRVAGTMRTHAQAHFYMETNCAIAYPGSYDEMTIFSSTQNPNGDQTQIAKVLGVKANQVTLRVEQLGGGFGGKQNRAVFIGAMAAIACKKTRRPVQLKLSRETDMHVVGKRHPHISDYQASYRDDGTISAMNLDLRADGGSTIDCSMAVIKGSVMMSDGCYRTPTFRSGGTVYKTNKGSNTAFRTFGQVQPHLVLEEAIEHIAFDLSQRTGRTVTAEEIRRQNLYVSSEYETADATHFGQPLWFCDLREQWDKLYDSSNFEDRLKDVRLFNATNRWRKRGISMIPLKYGIGFKQMPALNTSTALVHINKEDGSVTVVHGGVEMGQGLHTKIAQVVAHELNVPLPFVRIVRNNTDVISNAPATAASTGFDLNGGAVALACRTLKKRLDGVCDEVKRRHPELGDLRLQWREKWPTIVQHAYLQRVNLHSAELYKAPHYDTPVDHYDHGKFFAYFTYSFSVSEVEIDVLTGEFSVIRSDLLYDAGKSPNPALDIGQIEGGFVQGLGFVTTEETIFDEHGRLVTDNIWSYKPPCSKSIPVDLRVSLIERDTASCYRQEQAGLLAVKASKSTSEPTLSLGNSVYFAIKHAIMAARAEQTGKEEWIELPVPLSCQRIQQACNVSREFLTVASAKPKTHEHGPKAQSQEITTREH